MTVYIQVYYSVHLYRYMTVYTFTGTSQCTRRLDQVQQQSWRLLSWPLTQVKKSSTDLHFEHVEQLVFREAKGSMQADCNNVQTCEWTDEQS